MTCATKSSDDKRFNWLFFRRLWRLWWSYLIQRFLSKANLLLLTLLIMAILEQFVIYQIGLLPSKFYKVLGDKNKPEFWDLFGLAICIIVGMAIILSTKQFVASLLYLNWRENLTKNLHKFYFRGTNYYKINVLDRRLDNPDQRMTQDVDRLTQNLSQIIPVIIIWPGITAYYMYKAYEGSGYVGPVSAVVFFLVACFCNKFILTPTVRFYAKQEKCEGDLRFKHVQIRVHAESMAFFDSGKIERVKTNEKLGILLRVQNGLVKREWLLKFAINLCDYTGSILSYLNIAVPIFAGVYDDLTPTDLAALISRNAFVSIVLISKFTSLIDLANSIPDIAGTTHRIAELMDYLLADDDDHSFKGTTVITDRKDSSGDESMNKQPYEMVSNDSSDTCEITVPYKLEKVTYGIPTGETLIRDLSLTISSGVHLLISGDSGIGKTSLLRVLHKLWPVQDGSVECALKLGTGGVLYLPQKPFFTNGTLRTQICYPNPAKTDEDLDVELDELLRLTDLADVVERFGGLDMQALNWFDVLSPGEQQRLSFVRLFYHRPAFAILDEATSQLGIDMESVLYQHCKKLGITLISVGHRISLYQYHDQRLHLEGKGAWSLENLREVEGVVSDPESADDIVVSL